MRKFLCFLGLVFLFGCATSSHIITGKVHPAISPEAVKIYSSMPPGAEEIAILNAADEWDVKTDRSVSKIKKDAARLGANGIVIEKSHSSAWTGATLNAKAVFVPQQ